jgi:hypothetical protein
VTALKDAPVLSFASEAKAPTRVRRVFPDTSARIAILADQLPAGLTPAQQRFAASHFVGTQKLSLDLSRPLRAVNPNFLVLHYHLAMWQSAPNVSFIIDGSRWGNDYPEVNKHEAWFWHNERGQRVSSSIDGKLLMNVGNKELTDYWIASIVEQVRAGDYDGVFADSASPALLQWEANAPPEPRLAGVGARDTRFPELGGRTFVAAWETFISALDRALAANGVALIPNVGALTTGWDPTRYETSAGVFLEGFADPRFVLDDWKASTNRLLSMARLGKIIILQNYLGTTDQIARRRYFLANYLLVKGTRTYLDYFGNSIFEWYPEWELDLGRPLITARTIADLADGGCYRRDFEHGVALVNPTSAPVTATFASPVRRIEFDGGGSIDVNGTPPRALRTTTLRAIVVAPRSAEIVMR